ncbi:MAG: DNA repair protein RadC [Bacteroidales bacterium]|jgi:DNA repair protein RadC|nr:DNA repair protein RadC [Bacteroidales bacterium]MDD4175947.1 DNA repair protein RadC [Bacteroidales bacterium]MDD4740139.1 DNA repair protein RadC [Bacteroidales bacterium]MDY0333520.1 DNA repair protein RadC [Bacteroidales bacterium]NCU35878.1 DNA repair protein RadC [Candidatus Falkowbacteria bacterium]
MEPYTGHSAIPQWAESDRPREKLLLKGKTALTDAELLAILIRSGTPKLSAIDLAKQILSTVDNNLVGLSRLTVSDLLEFKGIGDAKAITVVAALELGRRRRGAEAMQRKTITSSADAYEVLQMHIGDIDYEQFAIIMLNQANQVLKVENISEGGITGTVVDPKRVFRTAINNNAINIILAHNHPSGSLKPSKNDLDLTQKLKKAGEYLQIMVLDHLIVGDNKYLSMADEGFL